ncbi:MAG TPA: WD40 repeat domain-containing protein, partial [Ktedonobacterales bacterium]
ARVSAWRVSPLAAATEGGARIAYVDGLTGALHIVHSDGQADTIVGSVSPTQSPSASFWASQAGRAALASLTWSPNGARLAYVAATADGGAQARTVTLSGADVALAPAFDAPITQLTWSADSQALAGATVRGGVSTVVVWRDAEQPAVTLPANPSDTQANIAQIAWSGATLTWAASHDGAIVGVYMLPPKSATATRLTAAGASYSAAAFTSARGGEWLLAGADTLSEARLASGGAAQVATPGTTASAIAWSPNGATAAVTFGDRLALWSDASGLTTLAQGAASQIAWSPDGTALAATQGQNVIIYRIADDAATLVERLTNGSAVVALAWAADARNLAIAESHGMALAPSDGAGATLLTSLQADNGALSWSVAR